MKYSGKSQNFVVIVKESTVFLEFEAIWKVDGTRQELNFSLGFSHNPSQSDPSPAQNRANKAFLDEEVQACSNVDSVVCR